MHEIIKRCVIVSLKVDNCGVCRKSAVMTGIVLSVIVVDRWLIAPDVGEFIIQSVFLLQTALKKPFLRVPFARFVARTQLW